MRSFPNRPSDTSQQQRRSLVSGGSPRTSGSPRGSSSSDTGVVGADEADYPASLYPLLTFLKVRDAKGNEFYEDRPRTRQEIEALADANPFKYTYRPAWGLRSTTVDTFKNEDGNIVVAEEREDKTPCEIMGYNTSRYQLIKDLSRAHRTQPAVDTATPLQLRKMSKQELCALAKQVQLRNYWTLKDQLDKWRASADLLPQPDIVELGVGIGVEAPDILLDPSIVERAAADQGLAVEAQEEKRVYVDNLILKLKSMAPGWWASTTRRTGKVWDWVKSIGRTVWPPRIVRAAVEGVRGAWCRKQRGGCLNSPGIKAVRVEIARRYRVLNDMKRQLAKANTDASRKVDTSSPGARIRSEREITAARVAQSRLKTQVAATEDSLIAFQYKAQDLPGWSSSDDSNYKRTPEQEARVSGNEVLTDRADDDLYKIREEALAADKAGTTAGKAAAASKASVAVGGTATSVV